jgi:hypothetical protein
MYRVVGAWGFCKSQQDYEVFLSLVRKHWSFEFCKDTEHWPFLLLWVSMMSRISCYSFDYI